MVIAKQESVSGLVIYPRMGGGQYISEFVAVGFGLLKTEIDWSRLQPYDRVCPRQTVPVATVLGPLYPGSRSLGPLNLGAISDHGFGAIAFALAAGQRAGLVGGPADRERRKPIVYVALAITNQTADLKEPRSSFHHAPLPERCQAHAEKT
jgi:hypothetical protein